MRKLLLLAAFLLVGWWMLGPVGPAPVPQEGVRIASAPIQTETVLQPWEHKGAMIQPLADYRIRARVLATKRYRFDRSAPLAPFDLALGWGEVSDSAVLQTISVSQSGRWYEFYASNDCPLTVAAISRQSANVHCLPADSGVKRQLGALRVNEFVELEGSLVEVRYGDGGSWRSSLTRDDTGNGSCEILWVTHVTVLPAGNPE